VEFAFLELDIQLAFLEVLENFSDTLDVFFEGAARINEDVVYISDTEYVQIFVESIVNVRLKGGGSIA